MKKLFFGGILILLSTSAALAQTALQITSTTIPNGAVGTAYTPFSLRATGGISPYNWTVSSGVLPQGLVLANDGVLTGNPGIAGTYTVVLSVTDTSVPVQTVLKTFVITIQPQLIFSTDVNLPLGVVGAFYTKQLETTGPNVNSWSVVAKNLPPGVSLSSTGSLIGSPSLAGTYDFTIQAAGGEPLQTARQTFTFIVNAALSITSQPTLADASLNIAYTTTMVATGGVPPYTWSSTGILPAGLTLSGAGVISGTSTALGSRSFPVTVTDSFTPPQEITRTFTITTVSPLTISTASIPNAYKDVDYRQQLQATGGAAPYTWVLSSGTLPDGITLSAGGLVSGKSEAVFAQQTLGITLTDGRGTVLTKTFNFAVDPPLSTFSAGLPASINPAQQSRVTLTLENPHPSALSGTLVLAFTSKAEVISDDPMTQFSTGSRSVTFTIPANSTTAEFTSDVLLKIGTVTGTVKLTATIKDGPSDVAVATVEVATTAPVISNVEVTRNSGGFDLQITGYATSKRITTVEFTFEKKVGKRTESQTLSRSVDTDFTNWFRNPSSVSFGSSFSFVQSFAVQGDVNQLETVTVKLTNAQGSTTSSAVRLK